MAVWTAPAMWQGGTCYIIGGGPSVPRVFNVPEDIAQLVMNGIQKPSIYSSYMEALKSKHVIAVNNAYQIGSWIDVMFFGDCNWYLQHRTPLAEWPGLKVTSCNRFVKKTGKDSDGIKYLGRDKEKKYGLTDNRTMISWNQNSGSASISMAVHFGVKRIVLLGFDMVLDDNKRSHWHNFHGNTTHKKKMRTPPFARHMMGFEEIAKDAEALGVEIVNASPTSAITQFKKVALEEALC